MQRHQQLLLSFLVLGVALFYRINVAIALTSEEIAEAALGSTVLIIITNRTGRSSLGSGFVVRDGQIATNYHVIEGVSRGSVRLVGGTTDYAVEAILAVDVDRDLAIIKATGVDAPALPLGDSDNVQIGEAVYVAGNPQGLEGTFSEGIISAIRPGGNSLVRGKILQITAPISPGSSGGPVLNGSGEVIGISVGQNVGGQNLNFAIPVNYLKPLITTRTADLHITEAYGLYSGSVSVDFSSDGRYIATGDTDGDMGLWRVSDGTNIYYKGLGGSVEGVAFNPDGSRFAADGNDGDPYVGLFEVSGGRELQRKRLDAERADAENVRAVAYSADGRYIAIGVDHRWAWLWEVGSGRMHGWGQPDSSEVTSVAFSPDGTYLATGDDDGRMTLWEVSRWWSGSSPRVWHLDIGGTVNALAFSADGKYLAADGFDGSNTNVTIREMSSGSTMWLRDTDVGQIHALAFSADGKYLAVGGTSARIDFYQIGADISKVKSISASGEVKGLAWSPDGTLISDGKKVWRVETVDEVLPIRLNIGAVSQVDVGERFPHEFRVLDVTDLAGWQLDVTFNPSVLQAVSVSEGDFLKKGGGTTFFRSGTIDNTAGTITGIVATFIGTVGVSGAGRLASVTFEAKASGKPQFDVHNVRFIDTSGEGLRATIIIRDFHVGDGMLAWDVNEDGEVDLLDLVEVSQSFGRAGSGGSRADVNGDGTVNISDLIIVAQHLGESNNPDAPSGEGLPVLRPLVELNTQVDASINSETVQIWLEMAYAADDGSLGFQLGIDNLKRLLAVMIPSETALLPNYPNPFNPETWIPYHLSQDAAVEVTIYDAKGFLVRRLDVGHRSAGYYTDRSKAVYWDGRNESGEVVASGVYFYQLRAGDYRALRRLVIVK